MNRRIVLLILILCCGIPSSQAALFDVPLPNNAFITLNGFDWAWGANCNANEGTGCDTLDFAFQTGQGWRIAEAGDMDLAPLATDFLFDGANVPYNGVDPITGASFSSGGTYDMEMSAGACASAYFTSGDGAIQCNFGNGSGQNINTNGWFNQNGESRFFADVLFVRDGTVIPVPAAVWLFGSSLIGLVGLARRRSFNA